MIYFKGFQALCNEHLRGMFRDCFGLSVSQGALMNMFICSHAAFKAQAAKAIVMPPPGKGRGVRRNQLAH